MAWGRMPAPQPHQGGGGHINHTYLDGKQLSDHFVINNLFNGPASAGPMRPHKVGAGPMRPPHKVGGAGPMRPPTKWGGPIANFIAPWGDGWVANKGHPPRPHQCPPTSKMSGVGVA